MRIAILTLMIFFTIVFGDTNDTTTKTQLEIVKQNGYNIQYIDKPSKEVQLAAVKQNGYAIKYIKNPSKKVINTTKRK